jgi:hypothetical protein
VDKVQNLSNSEILVLILTELFAVCVWYASEQIDKKEEK